MTFRVNHQSSDNPARCPYRVVVQATGREIGWINQHLDYETVRRLADHTLQSYANELLYFLRWWDSVHRTDAIAKDALTESTRARLCAIPVWSTAPVVGLNHQHTCCHYR